MADGCIRTAARTASRTRQRAAGAACSLLVSVGLLAALWGRTINHDTAWYLISTRKWLEGATLYVDLYEVNPPLNFYYTVPAVLLADGLGIGDVNAQYLVVAALTFMSLFWSWALVVDGLALPPGRQLPAFLGLSAVLTLPALSQVAQREHLMMLLALPWFLGQVRDEASGTSGRVARAASAALGFCLKPYFLAIPICVTLWHMIRRRSLRPIVSLDNMVMLALGSCYVLAARVIHPAYFEDIIPVARAVYTSFGSPTDFVLGRLAIAVAPFLLLLVLLPFGRRTVPAFGLIVSGIVAGVSSYLLQYNGFDYHLIPFESFTLLAAAWSLIHARRVTALAIAAALGFSAFAGLAIQRGTYDFWIRGHIEAAMGGRPPPRSLFVATTNVDAGPLLALELGADWISRYPHNWLVPGALGRLDATDCAAMPETCAELRAILAKNRDDDIADIERARPEMIIIDKRRGFVPTDGFSWYDFYAGNPRWGSVIAPYTLVGSTANFDTWSRAATGG